MVSVSELENRFIPEIQNIVSSFAQLLCNSICSFIKRNNMTKVKIIGNVIDNKICCFKTSRRIIDQNTYFIIKKGNDYKFGRAINIEVNNKKVDFAKSGSLLGCQFDLYFWDNAQIYLINKNVFS